MADNFYASYPVSGGGGAVSSVNSLTGALTLAAGSGISVTPSGNTLTIAATGGSGANTSLSNLTTTAINQDLIHGTPGTNFTVRTANNGAGNSGNMVLRSGTATGTRGNIQLAANSIVLGDAGVVTVTPANGGNLGSSTAPWSVIHSSLLGVDAASTQYEIRPTTVTTPSGSVVFGTIKSNANSGFAVFSASQAGNTGPLRLESGNSSSFASGLISLQTGTANTTSGGITISTGVGTTSSGNITLQTGTSAGTRGAVVVNGHLRSTQTTAPTIAANANAGTGATASLSNATDTAGNISLTTTSVASSAGIVATITFNKAYVTAPIAVLSPTNVNSIASSVIQGIFFTTTTTTLDINFNLADGVGRTFTWAYHVIETQ